MPTFGSRLFGSSPFAGTGGAVPAPPPSDLPADLAAAVAARFASDATLAATVTGGVFNGQATDGAAKPYAVFSEVSVRPYQNWGRGYYEEHYVRLSCFAAGARQAREAGDAVVAAFNLKPMAIASGYVMSVRWAGGHTVGSDHQRGKDSSRTWNRTVTFKITVGRTRP